MTAIKKFKLIEGKKLTDEYDKNMTKNITKVIKILWRKLQ